MNKLCAAIFIANAVMCVASVIVGLFYVGGSFGGLMFGLGLLGFLPIVHAVTR